MLSLPVLADNSNKCNPNQLVDNMYGALNKPTAGLAQTTTIPDQANNNSNNNNDDDNANATQLDNGELHFVQIGDLNGHLPVTTSSDLGPGANSGTGFGSGPNQADQKRIFSHCHVQQADDQNHSSQVPSNQLDVGARNRLLAVSVLCLLFMIGEVVGGILSNSLAIAADAAHLLTDLASFMISLFALWLASRPASREMSFGWYRAEVIGALLSVLMIWVVTGLIVYAAVERLRTADYEVKGFPMIITASAGLVVNIIMALSLHLGGGSGHHHHHHHHHHGHSHHMQNQDQLSRYSSMDLLAAADANNNTSNDSNNSGHNNHQEDEDETCKHTGKDRSPENLNIRAAFIHVIGDFVQSLGVLIAALVVYIWPEYQIVDPICTFVFAIIVLLTTIGILRDATNVLMEGIPNGINFIEVRERLQKMPGVIRVHNLRIWSLNMDKIAISTHLVIDNKHTPSSTLKLASDKLKACYNFFEITIQIEEYRDEMRNCEKCLDEKVVVTDDFGRTN